MRTGYNEQQTSAEVIRYHIASCVALSAENRVEGKVKLNFFCVCDLLTFHRAQFRCDKVQTCRWSGPCCTNSRDSDLNPSNTIQVDVS